MVSSKTLVLLAAAASFATSASAQTLTKVSGDGQITLTSFLAEQPFVVELRDQSGNPLPNVRIDFSAVNVPGFFGQPGSVNPQFANTDEKGRAQATFLGPVVVAPQSFVQSLVVARANAFQKEVTFTVSTVGTDISTGTPNADVQLIFPELSDLPLIGAPGVPPLKPIQLRVFGRAGAQANQGLPNVAVVVRPVADDSLAKIGCAGGVPLTNQEGFATCSQVFSGRSNQTSQFEIVVGGIFRRFGPFQFRTTVGPLDHFRIISGNSQAGNPGDTLPSPLVAVAEDAAGNTLEGVTVLWEPVTAGTVTVSNLSGPSDVNGRVSARLHLGNVPGVHQVRLRSAASNVQVLFNATVNLQLSQLQKVSGDNQDTIINTPFTEPLTVRVLGALSAPVQGANVQFTVLSGAATLSSGTVATDAAGLAKTTVTAGAAAGPITVQASIANFTVSFLLNSRPPGPGITPSSFYNSASGQAGGVSPGTLVSIYGAGLATGLQGCVTGTFLVGALPFQLANVTFQFGSLAAPIYAVCNLGQGQEYAVVQVPAELPVGTTTVTARVGQASVTTLQNIPVTPVHLGVFETVMSDGRKRVVAVREDGSYVSLTNPLRRGEKGTVFVLGLGQPRTPSGALISTNQLGGNLGATTIHTPIVVGLNNEGINVVSSTLTPDLIGVHIVTFEVPLNTATGPNVPFVVAVTINDNLVFSQGTSVPVQ